jgi:UDP-N-acetylglucosamine 2-epimerase (non-hydrolysing)
MLKIILVAGARPNFMKIAPLLRVMEKDYQGRIKPILVHTGQHYDRNMSQAFFDSLGIRAPDYHLKVGSGSHADQTAAIMTHFEDVCEDEAPDTVVVVGDVNSTIAAGLVAKKLNITLAHVEAGLRSGDRTMPEEINRLATDAISDLFFTTEEEATRNLIREGHRKACIHFVGHVMIDNLYYQLSKLDRKGPSPWSRDLKARLPERYLCMTLHRPSNVDDRNILAPMLKAIDEVACELPVIFPCHPRTGKKIEDFGLQHLFSDYSGINGRIHSGILRLDPLDYNDFLHLWRESTGVLTDSGGLQEETTALGIPCITLRENTERPITLDIGSNVLAGQDPKRIKAEVSRILAGERLSGKVPELWDGMASERIVWILNSNGASQEKKIAAVTQTRVAGG